MQEVSDTVFLKIFDFILTKMILNTFTIASVLAINKNI